MLRIAKWSETFENSTTRKLVSISYMMCPTGVDSAGYVELMSHGTDGMMAYAVFLAICQWSATNRPEIRGLIARSDGRPMSVRQLAVIIRMPTEIVERAVELLQSEDVGWITDGDFQRDKSTHVHSESPSDLPTSPSDLPTSPSDLPTSPSDLPTSPIGRGREGKGEEGIGREGRETAFAVVADATDPPGESQAADVIPVQSAAACPYIEIGRTFDATFGGRSQLTDKRRKAMQARWREPWWREHWRIALERAGPSSFLRGGNDRGWVIDLEFFLRPDTVAKILEGKYDNRQTTARGGNNAAAREQRNADAFSAVYAAAAAAASAGGG